MQKTILFTLTLLTLAIGAAAQQAPSGRIQITTLLSAQGMRSGDFHVFMPNTDWIQIQYPQENGGVQFSNRYTGTQDALSQRDLDDAILIKWHDLGRALILISPNGYVACWFGDYQSPENYITRGSLPRLRWDPDHGYLARDTANLLAGEAPAFWISDYSTIPDWFNQPLVVISESYQTGPVPDNDLLEEHQYIFRVLAPSGQEYRIVLVRAQNVSEAGMDIAETLSPIPWTLTNREWR